MSVFDDVSAAGLRAVSTPPTYLSDRPQDVPAQVKRGLDGRENGIIRAGIGGFGVGSAKPEASSESSSIGVPDESDEEENEEEVESKSSKSLCALAALEESLPIKRGLSAFVSGKSRSLANFSEVSSVKDLEKRENPLNKRRRLMIAYKWSKEPSFYRL